MSGDAAPKVDQVKSFLAGGAAGISAVLVGVRRCSTIWETLSNSSKI